MLVYWITNRESIRRLRAAGAPPPWTSDLILSAGHFDNVRRPDDRVSRWIHFEWIEPHADHPDLFLACTVARFINEPEVLAEVGFPLPWDPERFVGIMAARKARGAKLERRAYMIHADRKPGQLKAEYMARRIFTPMWRSREFLRPVRGETLARYHGRLSELHGMAGGFMSGQVIADLKFAEPLRSASDWYTFTASGPGSRRGLNRVLGRPVDAPWTEGDWQREFARVRSAVMPDLERLGLGDLDSQSLQSCLCELHKYERAREGGSMRRFRPNPEPLPIPRIAEAAE
jgi:hypothetical protein